MKALRGQGGVKPVKLPAYEKEPKKVELDYTVVKKIAALLKMLQATKLSPNNRKIVDDLAADIKTGSVIASEKLNNPKFGDKAEKVINSKKN